MEKKSSQTNWKLPLLCLLGSLAFGSGIALLMLLQKAYLWAIIAAYIVLIGLKRDRCVWLCATLFLCGLFFWYFVWEQKFSALISERYEVV
jgi:hypothetical protein